MLPRQLQDLADEAGPYRLMVLVLGLCGLRFGECAGLRVRSVDLVCGRLRVTEAVSEVNGRPVWSTPKTHRHRDVTVPGAATGPAGRAHRRQEARRRGVPQTDGRDSAAGQLASAGVGRRGPGRRLRCTPHDLRYTAASLAVASGASVTHVQRMIGHKYASMTSNVDVSLFEDDLDQVADRLDAALRTAGAASVRPETRFAVSTQVKSNRQHVSD